jgi:chorismate-pyruvate lyase
MKISYLHQTAAAESPRNGHAPAPGLLFPLDEFYLDAGRPLPPAVRIEGEEVPEPYRQLLVHDRDMTPTLEAFHGERIHLRLLQRRVDGAKLWRQVVLTLNDSKRPVEFGAIVIHCDHFPPAAREQILACHRPLGTILADHAIHHASAPHAFLRVEPDLLICEALATTGIYSLYGRRNVLTTPGGGVLADILEILPPSATRSSGERRVSHR